MLSRRDERRPRRVVRMVALGSRRVAVVLALAVVVEMPIAEFVAVQEMNDRERRRRFGLPETCEPSITAVRATRGRVHVLVTCPSADEPNEPDLLG